MGFSRLFVALLALVLYACYKSGFLTPDGKVTLLPCPNQQPVRVSQQIGTGGGTLQIGEHRLVVPAGALQRPVTFTGTVLRDKVLKVQLQADGADSFRFIRPASLTLSYGRCEPPPSEERLRIYKIDPLSNKILRDMGGEVNPRERSVTAPLDSLSTYTLGSPT